MKDRNQMTRTCSACGIEKPLAAFLELSAKGTRYGTICATCRGAGITEKKKTALEDDKSTMSTSGSRIGSKERIFVETQQKKQIETAKNERIDQLAKRDTLIEEKKEKVDLKDKSERDHRRTYLDLKKQPGFLGKKLPAGSLVRTPPPANTQPGMPPGEKTQEKKALDDKKQHEEVAAQQETKQKTFNLKDQFVDPQAGETRAHSATFLAFQDSLEVTPFKAIRERLKKLATATATPAADSNKAASAKDPLLDFVEKTWSGPSSTRRR